MFKDIAEAEVFFKQQNLEAIERNRAWRKQNDELWNKAIQNCKAKGLPLRRPGDPQTLKVTLQGQNTTGACGFHVRQRRGRAAGSHSPL
jgi:hypothetical protein